jgi:hypothetical protein
MRHFRSTGQALAEQLALIKAHQPPANRAHVNPRSADHAAPGPGEASWLFARAGLTDWISNPGLGALDMEPTYVSTYGTDNLYSGLGATPRAMATAKAKAAAAARAKMAAAKAAAAQSGTKTKGPPPWSRARALRDGDSKVAKRMPASAKAAIDRLPLSSAKKKKLKEAPVSFFADLARTHPGAVAEHIRRTLKRGQASTAVVGGKRIELHPNPKDKPETLAAKFVASANVNPKAAAEVASSLSGSSLNGFGAIDFSGIDFVGITNAAATLGPMIVGSLTAVAGGKTPTAPSPNVVAATQQAAASTSPAMTQATPPAAQAAAQAAASEENKILGLPPAVVYGGGAVAVLLLALKMRKK